MTDVITQVSEKAAGKIIAGGVGLSFKADSLLAPISGELHLIADNSNEPSLESLAAAVNQYFEDSNPNPFETSMESFNLGNTFLAGVESLTADLEPMAAGILSNIKNVIIPTTNTIFEIAYSATSDACEDGGVRLDIVTDGSEHPFFTNVALTSIIDAYSATGELQNTHTSGLTFPDLPTETLLTALNSVNTSLNGDLSDLLGIDSETLIQTAYKSVFNVAGGTPVDYTCLFGQELKIKAIALLLAIAFSEEVPEGVFGVDDLGQYRAILRKTIGCFALHVNNVLKYTETMAKQDRLVLNFPTAGSEFTTGASIVVNGRLFNRWLELGGTVDAIYGAYVSDSKANGTALIEELEKYERSWQRYIATKQSSMRDDFESLFVSRLRDAIYAYGKENNMKVNRSGIDTMFERSSSLDADNAYPFARRIICDCLFDPGEHLTILENVDSISTASPEITLEDAVEIATTEWLVDWALDQINISKP